MIDFTLREAAFLCAIFTLAGAVKGLAGFGFPAVTLGLTALFRPLPEAMALMIVPAMLTNVWQAFAGPALRPLLRRLWSFFLTSTLGAIAGAAVLARADQAVLGALLGLLLVAGALLALFGRPFGQPTPGQERVLSPVMGAASGVITGLTGSYLMPAAPYLVALRLSPAEFVQAFGLGVIGALVALAFGMAGAGLLPAELGLASVFGVVPGFLGLWIGQKARAGMPEARFRTVIQIALGLLGCWLVVKALR